MLKFLNDKIKESEYCSKVSETEFNKPLVLNEKDHEDFNNSTKCWTCKKAYEEDEVTIKDHGLVTGKECDLDLSLSKKSLLFSIICKIMISILSIKKLENIILK